MKLDKLIPRPRRTFLLIRETSNRKGIETNIDEKAIQSFTSMNKEQVIALLIGALKTLGVDLFGQEDDSRSRETYPVVEKDIQPAMQKM